jgi:hypothetical protein
MALVMSANSRAESLIKPTQKGKKKHVMVLCGSTHSAQMKSLNHVAVNNKEFAFAQTMYSNEKVCVSRVRLRDGVFRRGYQESR